MYRYIIQALCVLLTVGCTDQKVNTLPRQSFDETGLRAWVSTIPNDNAHAKLSLDSILRAAKSDSALFMQTVAYLEKALGDPNSPYRNEMLYGELLQAKLKSPFTDSMIKTQTREKLYLLMQNRPGSAANDFTYYTVSSAKKTLYALKAPYTLLYFYNPECDACKQMKAALTASPVIGKTVTSDKLKVLAVYTDKDEKTWLNHLPDMPADWLHGRDEDEYLYKNKVYDLRAIPTLYLLDRDKKVLLKDVSSIPLIEEVLRQPYSGPGK